MGVHMEARNADELAAWTKRQFGALAGAYVDERVKESTMAGDADQMATWKSVKQMLG